MIATQGAQCALELVTHSARHARRDTPLLTALVMRLYASTLSSRILIRYNASLATPHASSAVDHQIQSARFANYLQSSRMEFARSATSTMDTLSMTTENARQAAEMAKSAETSSVMMATQMREMGVTISVV